MITPEELEKKVNENTELIKKMSIALEGINQINDLSKQALDLQKQSQEAVKSISETSITIQNGIQDVAGMKTEVMNIKKLTTGIVAVQEAVITLLEEKGLTTRQEIEARTGDFMNKFTEAAKKKMEEKNATKKTS